MSDTPTKADVTTVSQNNLAGVTPLLEQLWPEEKRNYLGILTKMMQAPNYNLSGIEVSGKLMAFICMHISIELWSESPILTIDALVVDAAMRGKGTGSVMLEFAEEFAQTNKCQYVVFTSATSRRDAHSFYMKHGYAIQDYAFFKKLF